MDLVDIMEELIQYVRGVVADGARWVPDAATVEENGIRNYGMQHLLMQDIHITNLLKLATEWDVALVARTMFETSVVLRWAVKNMPDSYHRLKTVTIVYDYETLKKKDPRTPQEQTDMDQLLLDIHANYIPHAFAINKASQLAATPDPTRDDFKRSHNILPKIEEMFTDVGVSYDRYRMLSEWTHGSAAGFARVFKQLSPTQWQINNVSLGWLHRCHVAASEALLETAIITAEFRDAAGLPRLRALQTELQPYVDAASQ